MRGSPVSRTKRQQLAGRLAYAGLDDEAFAFIKGADEAWQPPDS